jgi:hypothetical protein
MNFLAVTPKQLFLVDATGAAISAALLAGVVARYEGAFGLTPFLAYRLSIGAVVLFVYSLTCGLALGTRFQYFLKALALGNIAYAIATVIILVTNYQQVRLLGFIYFTLEIGVIFVLARWEWRVASSK